MILGWPLLWAINSNILDYNNYQTSQIFYRSWYFGFSIYVGTNLIPIRFILQMVHDVSYTCRYIQIKTNLIRSANNDHGNKCILFDKENIHVVIVDILFFILF